MGFARLVSVFAAAATLCSSGAVFTHGWGSVSEQLAGNFGTWNAAFNESTAPATWTWIAKNYAIIAINDFFQRGQKERAQAVRTLKSINPSIKVLWYQAADWVSQDPAIVQQINANPAWWLHDDYGNVISFAGVPVIDHSSEEARAWFINLPLQNLSLADAKYLVDGIFVDGTSFSNQHQNVSANRYAKSLFPGKMAMMAEAQSLYTALNGGDVWGNPLLEYGNIGRGIDDPSTDWNATLYHYSAAFDEMFGSFGTLNYPADGQWNATKMAFCIESIQNATSFGKGVIVHAFPGPANPPFGSVPGITSAFPAWDGLVPRPDTVAGLQKASQDMLVQSLAPYLIVAEATTFFSYAWFYDYETGYGLCPDALANCSAPAQWYPEFSKPLGAPLGPAVRNGLVYTREFASASVYVDLSDRTKAAITWT